MATKMTKAEDAATTTAGVREAGKCSDGQKRCNIFHRRYSIIIVGIGVCQSFKKESLACTRDKVYARSV